VYYCADQPKYGSCEKPRPFRVLPRLNFFLLNSVLIRHIVATQKLASPYHDINHRNALEEKHEYVRDDHVRKLVSEGCLVEIHFLENNVFVFRKVFINSSQADVIIHEYLLREHEVENACEGDDNRQSHERELFENPDRAAIEKHIDSEDRGIDEKRIIRDRPFLFLDVMDFICCELVKKQNMFGIEYGKNVFFHNP
jgi:hypothetical protein